MRSDVVVRSVSNGRTDGLHADVVMTSTAALWTVVVVASALSTHAAAKTTMSKLLAIANNYDEVGQLVDSQIDDYTIRSLLGRLAVCVAICVILSLDKFI